MSSGRSNLEGDTPMTILNMTNTTEVPTPDPVAGVPMVFMQECMCRALLVADADPMRSRCCGEPVPEGVKLCEYHDA